MSAANLATVLDFHLHEIVEELREINKKLEVISDNQGW